MASGTSLSQRIAKPSCAIATTVDFPTETVASSELLLAWANQCKKWLNSLMVVVDVTNGWFVSWNACHKFGRDTQMWVTACLPRPGKSFHASPQEAHIFLPEFLLPWSCQKPLRRSQWTNQVLERRKDQEWRPKWCRQCYTALAQTQMAILNTSSTLTVIPALVESGTRL